MPDDLFFTVELWAADDLRVDKVKARADNALIARGAYEAAVRQYPNRIVRLRDSARVIAEHVPDCQ